MYRKFESQINLFLGLFLSVGVLWMLLGRIAAIFTFNSDISGVEEVFIYYIQRLMITPEFYPDPTQPPYIISQYSPIFFYTTALLSKMFNIDPAVDFIKIFWIGRSVSFFANVLTFLAITKTIGLFKKLKFIDTLLIFILYFGTLTHHSFAARPDALKVMFLICANYQLFKYQFTDRKADFLMAVILFVLAIFTKQDALIESAIISVIYVLFFRNNLKKEVPIVIGVLVTLIMLFYVLFKGQQIELLFIKTQEHISFNYLKFILNIYRNYMTGFIILLAGGFGGFIFTYQKTKSLTYLAFLLIPISLYNITSISFWGASFVYVSVALVLSIVLLGIVLPRRLLIVISCLIILLIVKRDKYYTSYIKERFVIEEPYKLEHKVRLEVKNYLIENGLEEKDDILTFDKLLTNYLFEHALFPTYEAEGIEYFYYGDIPMEEYKRLKKIDYDLDYIKKSGQPKFVITNHESQYNLKYNGIDLSNYNEIGEIAHFNIFKRDR